MMGSKDPNNALNKQNTLIHIRLYQVIYNYKTCLVQQESFYYLSLLFAFFIINIHSQLYDAANGLEDLDQIYEKHWLANVQDSEFVKRRVQNIPTGNTRRQLQRLIAHWYLDAMDRGQRSHSIIKGVLSEDRSGRIDLQSPITKHGMPYYNVQVQLGTNTYSTVFIPAGVTLGKNRIRNAFVESMNSGRA
ncbi:unnamed protein product [Rotaria sp. Silwood2]|nr:unnamed protein product [Rotaria sp. Silwood2]